MNTLTQQDILDHWLENLRSFFDKIKIAARPAGWNLIADQNIEITEELYVLGVNVSYTAPVLILERAEPVTIQTQQITFEPRHRNTLGSAGRIDVYSYPAMHEAMLLRIPTSDNANKLTFEAAEQRVEETPWTAYSTERMPLSADLTTPEGMRSFLDDLVASRQ